MFLLFKVAEVVQHFSVDRSYYFYRKKVLPLGLEPMTCIKIFQAAAHRFWGILGDGSAQQHNPAKFRHQHEVACAAIQQSMGYLASRVPGL